MRAAHTGIGAEQRHGLEKDCARAEKHEFLDGRPTNSAGVDLPPGTAPPTVPDRPNDYTPYESRAHFQMANLLFRKIQMKNSDIDELMSTIAGLPGTEDGVPPFAGASDLYETIDAGTLGDAPWDFFEVSYDGPLPTRGEIPEWMTDKYTVWCRDPRVVIRNQLANPAFKGQIDYAPLRQHDTNGKRQWKNFMSGNWAWKEANAIALDPNTHGAMSVPIISGSDKTTVTVGTGAQEFYPLYASTANLHNNIRRSHKDGLSVIGFLSIPHTNKKYAEDNKFREFRRQLFHTSLEMIFEPLRNGMTTPEVAMCPDGHFRRVIYSLGPYIADYPEQVLLTSVVKNWCPRCTADPEHLDTSSGDLRSRDHTEYVLDALSLKEAWDDYGIVGTVQPFMSSFPRANVHELVTSDLLHQAIKGTFKDHFVKWVHEWLLATHGETEANTILADIDRRIAAAPAFPGLRRFPNGVRFHQWTGDDSKALMKVYLPAVKGHVPAQMVRALSALLDFIYLARRSVHDEATIAQVGIALARYHIQRQVFVDLGVVEGEISLPRQHSLMHYKECIQLFGALNGLCSSITESKHIRAVKEPWRRSSRNVPLGEMLTTNQRLDKLSAAHADFTARGMLNGDVLHPSIEELTVPNLLDDEGGDEADDGMAEDDYVLAEVTLARSKSRDYAYQDLASISATLGIPELHEKIRRYLFDFIHPDSELDSSVIAIDVCPPFDGNIDVFNSAVAVYFAPSDPAGIDGLHRERIRATPSWKKGPARRDCVFIPKDGNDADAEGFSGLHVAQVLVLFSFKHEAITHSCALVHWFVPVGEEPCEETGMWIVKREMTAHGERVSSVISVDCILRSAHLIPNYGPRIVPHTITHLNSLQKYRTYFVSKYADHHANEIAF